VAKSTTQRMPSPEGRGNARARWQKAWDAYSRAVSKAATPIVEPAVRPLARTLTFDSMGFWLAWQLEGGFEGLQKSLGMSRSAVYRRLALFRAATGSHPDEFEFPGVRIDLGEYIASTQSEDPIHPNG
jgi:hypothetical protein